MTLSVLRRYTPPTCTLEIMGNQSPLSRWMGQPVLKQLRFQLSLDDPKLATDRWVVLRGDRPQLEALYEAVSTYVQRFLEQSEPLKGAKTLTQTGAIATLERDHLALTNQASSSPNAAGISLRPRGLLAHELTLGTLATQESGPTVRLSALQLFDLANALDDYTAEIVSLPNLQPQKSAWKPSPAWAQVAVACLVVGLSASVVKLMQGPDPASISQTAAPANSQRASSSDQQIATQLPPAIADKTTPAPGSSQKLPPLPPPGSMNQNPALPRVTVPPVISANPAGGAGESGAGTLAKPGMGDRVATLPRGMTSAYESRGRSSAASPALPAPVLSDRANSATAKQPAAMAESGQSMMRSDAPAAPSGTAFDTIPQVAEARRYFQQRWNPPQGLTQTLEYSLVVAPDGTIRQILPLGQAAGAYVDRTNIPLVGEPFLSPIKGGRSAKIRLVLSPDGKVQTFLE